MSQIAWFQTKRIYPQLNLLLPLPWKISVWKRKLMTMKMKLHSWEASVARNIMVTSRARSHFPKQTSTLEDLQPDTDNDIIDVTNYSERHTNDKRSPWPKQAVTTHATTQRHCPMPQNSPTYLPMNTVAAAPAKPHRTKIQGILPDKRKVLHGWPACLRRQPPRVVFRNNDIYMVNDKVVNIYEEPNGETP